MKKLYFLILSMLLLACSNSNREASVSSAEISEEMEIDMVENVLEKNTVENFPFETITTQKLQEYIDLQVLMNAHPDDKTIKEQLRTAGDSELLILDDGLVQLKTVTAMSPLEQLNDSTQQIRLEYAIDGVQLQQKTAITAVIKTSEIQIDGETIKTTKITFKD